MGVDVQWALFLKMRRRRRRGRKWRGKDTLHLQTITSLLSHMMTYRKRENNILIAPRDLRLVWVSRLRHTPSKPSLQATIGMENVW